VELQGEDAADWRTAVLISHLLAPYSKSSKAPDPRAYLDQIRRGPESPEEDQGDQDVDEVEDDDTELEISEREQAATEAVKLRLLAAFGIKPS
jgi:hypothetical protein